MLFRKHIVSTRTLLQLTVALVFFAGGVGAALAANNGPAPLLVPYTIKVIAGNPALVAPATTVAVGYFGENIPATPTATKAGATLDAPYSMAIDSVGNVYITDTGNDIIREVNAQSGLITTIAGIPPQGCSGVTCSLRTTGCADGVPAAAHAIGSHVEGIAIDSYGNVYFDDNTTATVSVIYRGGTQVAAFITLVDPGGVAKSGGSVQEGFVYHVGGTINLTNCAATTGSTDNALAFEDSSVPPATAGAQLKGPTILSLDSAGNIYIADIGNATVRVINTQATAQTFFQYTVQPGYMRAITNCSSLTNSCPSAVTTSLLNTGINGPANGLVMNSQYKYATVDAYGNIYEGSGTGGSTGAPGIYGAAVYAGGAPLTNLLTAEAPSLAATYPSPSELPLTYGNAYVDLGNPSVNSGSLGSNFPDVMPTQNENFPIRPASMRVDPFGTYWYLDTHYPELSRIDQYTSLATLTIWWKGRTFGNIAPINNTYASFTNPYYCVYGDTGSPTTAWKQGPQTFDPEGDGCPAGVAYFGGSTSSGPDTASDGLGNIYIPDDNNEIMRELPLGNAFPTTAVGTPVTQAIQVHFNSKNPPIITGTSILDAADNDNSTTTSFSIPPGIADFTINTTTPEFPFGSLINSKFNASGYTTTTTNFAMWAGLPVCTQLGVFPSPVSPSVTDWDCLVYVTFNPTAPGMRQSQLKVTTADGTVYNFSLSGVGDGSQLAIDGGAATVVAATGLGKTGSIAVTQSGTVYIADPDNNRVVVEPAGGGTQTTIGTGLKGPMGVAVDGANNVYISDTGNNRVLKVDPLRGTQTVLGNNVWIPGPQSSTAPGSAVTATTPPPQYQFKAPQGLAVDAWNNVYVADTGNAAVVEIPSDIKLGGAVPLLAYPGAPKFVNPVAVTVDSLGNIYVADTREATSQIVMLPPGGGDLVTVPTSQFPNVRGSSLKSPNGVAVDAAGNVYVSDSSANQVVEFPAGTGANAAPFALNFPGINTPAGLALDANGNLYVADSGNKQILFDNRQSPIINFGQVPQSLGSPAQPLCAGTTISDGHNIGNSKPCVLTVTNIGSQAIPLTSPVTTITAVSPAGSTAFNVTNTCSTSLSPGVTCVISPTFQPTSSGAQMENINVNNGSTTLALVANASAVGVQPLVNIILSAGYSSGTTPTSGATATITATVTQPHIPGNVPTGTVTFTYTIDASAPTYSCGSGGTQTVTLNGAGIASFNLPTLAQGLQYTVAANYDGDTLNSSTQATPFVVQVPGINETVVAASVSFTYGQAVPAITGTVTPAPASPTTFTFTSGATSSTPIGTYPIQVLFSGGNYCSYGFPPAVTSTGAPAVVTENPATLKYTIPNLTAQYGALPISYGANAVVTGAVNGDTFSATFTPPDSSVLNVSTVGSPYALSPTVYALTPTVTGASVGNYTITAPPSTLTITLAPAGITVVASQTAVLNTAAGLASAPYQLVVNTLVTPGGKGVPTGTVTVTDNFTPITLSAPGTGTPVAPVTTVLPLTAGFTSYTPTSTTPGTHFYSFAYSGDSNFQCSVFGQAATSTCPTTGTATTSLVVDNPDFTVGSTTGVINIIPGVVPSGNGLPPAANQSTAAPETAVISISSVLGFVGQVSLVCTTQHPSYVNCSMTPPVVCFAPAATTTCAAAGSSTASILSVWTPATLPLGFSTAQIRMSTGKTVLAFLPFGILAFCFRRRRRLSKALWMLMAIAAVSAGMSGCGGNQVDFFTPVPTGPQTVTITATFGPATSSIPAETRSFVVPISIN